jgi:CTP synthase (UTP-ammonia lyase)
MILDGKPNISGTALMHTAAIALIGDFSLQVPAHRAIPLAIEMASSRANSSVSWRCIETNAIRNAERDLADYAAVWVMPGSPYANAAGVLDAIRWARERKRPFLGTCGGFQHALVEFARNVAGLATAGHAETDPLTDMPLVVRLACPLVETIGTIHFDPNSQIRKVYGNDRAIESYHCSYGLNPEYQARLASAGMCFSALDEAGEARALELPTHPFFIGTLFQPERAALQQKCPPLAAAFVSCIAGDSRA